MNNQEKEIQYLKSLHNDDVVIRHLPLNVFRVGGEQYIGHEAYTPTIFAQLTNAMWVPVEIKASINFHKKIKHIDLKRNQVFQMKKLNGYFLVTNETHYLIISAELAIKHGSDIPSGKFTNKPCYRVLKEDFNKCGSDGWVQYPHKLTFQ